MENQADTVIGVEVNVKGDIKNKGSIQINGTVEGEIKSDEDVTIGQTASVIGPTTAKNILVSGKVNGILTGNEKVEIDPTGSVNGDIKTKVLIIREGAVFNGNCSMSNENKTDTSANGESDKTKDDSNEKAKVITENVAPKSSFWDKGKK